MNRWWLLVGLWLLYTAFGLIATSLAPLVLPIEAELSISHAAMGSVMGAWQLVYIFAAIPGGALLDRLGGRLALTIGGLCIALSAFGRAYATDYWTLLLAVGLFGIGGPIVSSGAPKVVTQHFSGSERGLAMGVYMTGPAIGGVVSLTLTHSTLLPMFDGSWRAVMLLWAGVAAGAAIVWALIAGRAELKSQPTGHPASSPAASQTGVIRELIAVPAVQVLLLMSVGVFLFNHGLNNWLPELLRNHGMSIVTAGYWAALPTIVGIAGSLLIPRLATPQRRFHILLALCIAALLASLLLQIASGPWLVVGLVMQGIARSALMTVLVLTLVELPAIGEARTGIASGLFFSAAEVGGVLGPLGMGVLYDTTGHFGSALFALSAVAAFLCFGTLYLAKVARGASRTA